MWLVQCSFNANTGNMFSSPCLLTNLIEMPVQRSNLLQKSHVYIFLWVYKVAKETVICISVTTNYSRALFELSVFSLTSKYSKWFFFKKKKYLCYSNEDDCNLGKSDAFIQRKDSSINNISILDNKDATALSRSIHSYRFIPEKQCFGIFEASVPLLTLTYTE
jgi:hypothetical protein